MQVAQGGKPLMRVRVGDVLVVSRGQVDDTQYAELVPWTIDDLNGVLFKGILSIIQKTSHRNTTNRAYNVYF